MGGSGSTDGVNGDRGRTERGGVGVDLQIAVLSVQHSFTSFLSQLPSGTVGSQRFNSSIKTTKQSTSHEQVLLLLSPVCLLVPPHLRLWRRLIPNVLPLLLCRRWPQLCFKPHVFPSLRGQERQPSLLFQLPGVLWCWGSRVRLLNSHAHLLRRETRLQPG